MDRKAPISISRIRGHVSQLVKRPVFPDIVAKPAEIAKVRAYPDASFAASRQGNDGKRVNRHGMSHVFAKIRSVECGTWGLVYWSMMLAALSSEHQNHL